MHSFTMFPSFQRVIITGALMAILAPILTGCATGSSHRSSSVAAYLYGKEQPPAQTVDQTPVLRLPLVVGVAFVPSSGGGYGELSEIQKGDLLRQVSAKFAGYEFIKKIEVIPSAYMYAEGGFTNVDQLAAMFALDVIALVSYDQTQFTDEDLASLAYWTIIGLYIVEGGKNDTQTMLDTTVFDIQSRKLLFRAPGNSRVKGRAAYMNQEQELREDGLKGFQLASQEMAVNLDTELAAFKERVKQNPELATIEHREGYTGAGDMGFTGAVLSLMLLGAVAWRNYRRAGEA